MYAQFFGSTRLTRKLPAFGVPVYKCLESNTFFAQQIDDGDKIVDFLPMHASDIAFFVQAPIGTRTELSIGSSGLFAFYLTDTESVVGDRATVEEYIDANMNVISNSAVTNLMALRFIGCSRSRELEAIDRLSALIKNEEVRNRFSRIEYAVLPGGERYNQIDNLIDELSSSSTFAQTHAIVARLWAARNEILPDQFKTAMRACLSNNQVSWIAGDDDVRQFTDFLISTGRLRLTERALEKLKG